MAGAITVRLPDGSTKELADGTTALELAAVHRAAAGQGGGGGHRRRRRGRPVRGAARRGRGGRRHRRFRRGRDGPPPLDRPRAGPGGAAAVAGRPLRHRAGHRGRLLLRLRAARRGPLQRRRPRPHRGDDARDHRRGPAVRPRRALDRRGAGAVRRPAVQARDHRGGRAPAPTSTTPARPMPAPAVSTYANADASSTCAAGPTCPRPAGSVTSS